MDEDELGEAMTIEELVAFYKKKAMELELESCVDGDAGLPQVEW